jgi:hypothetical protein
MLNKINEFVLFVMVLVIWRQTDLEGIINYLFFFSLQEKKIFLFRLLNLDVGQWCHLNCALWSTEVYETVSGALMSVEIAYKRSINTECASCKQKGGSLTCFSQRCPNTYHFPCAVNSGCVFYKNKVRIKKRNLFLI